MFVVGFLFGLCVGDMIEICFIFDEKCVIFVVVLFLVYIDVSEVFVVFVGEFNFVLGICELQGGQFLFLGRVVFDGIVLFFELCVFWCVDLVYMVCFDLGVVVESVLQFVRFELSLVFEGVVLYVVFVWLVVGVVFVNFLCFYVMFD